MLGGLEQFKHHSLLVYCQATPRSASLHRSCYSSCGWCRVFQRAVSSAALLPFMVEYAPDERRGYSASWLEFGTLVGFSLGAGLVTYRAVASGPDSPGLPAELDLRRHIHTSIGEVALRWAVC